MELWGSWNSVSASLLSFSFEKCNPKERKTCKKDSEVQEWLKDKYVLFAYDQYFFNQDSFGDESFRKGTRMDWQRINIQ